MDGGSQKGDFYTCSRDWFCSESTVRSVLTHYVTSPNATCQDYARTHVGGPGGPSRANTLNQWYKVEDCLDYGIDTLHPEIIT